MYNTFLRTRPFQKLFREEIFFFSLENSISLSVVAGVLSFSFPFFVLCIHFQVSIFSLPPPLVWFLLDLLLSECHPSTHVSPLHPTITDLMGRRIVVPKSLARGPHLRLVSAHGHHAPSHPNAFNGHTCHTNRFPTRRSSRSSLPCLLSTSVWLPRVITKVRKHK